jgi:flagellar hook assembly protein FlgD
MGITTGVGSTTTVSTTNTGANNSATTSDDTLGPNAFLQLLTTELQNQNPDSPQDATESVTQLAQMSELQYQQQLTSAFQSFQSNFAVLQSASLIGTAATVSTGTSSTGSNSSTVTGIISSITVQNGEPYFTMTNSSGQTITDNNGNPLLFSTTQILGIGSASSVTGTNSNTSNSSRL